jgi:SAM-dependent methyltransferase
MTWRKYLLIPQLSMYAMTAPRRQDRAWERYWSTVARTGVSGEVLWDAEVPDEIDAVVQRLRARAELSLPLVDLGCGNGRQARALTSLAPRVIGLDASVSAIERARAETPDGTVEYRVADATQPDLGARLATELGAVNVHIRGMLHVVDPTDRARVVSNLSAMLGERGTAYVSETDVSGDPLEHLLYQGATATSMPDVLRRCVAAGVRAPSQFGPAQVAEYFPAPDWRILDSGPTVMYGVPLRPGDGLQRIPSYFAILKPARS